MPGPPGELGALGASGSLHQRGCRDREKRALIFPSDSLVHSA